MRQLAIRLAAAAALAAILLIPAAAQQPPASRPPAGTAASAAGPAMSPAMRPPMGPPMGWNSWDSFGLTITGPQVRAQARGMAAYLERYGWRYMTVDEGWFIRNPAAPARAAEFTLDARGRYIPAPNRFPRGFAALARYLHGMGLKFGVHLLRGIPREAVRRDLPIAGSRYRAAQAANPADTCSWNTDNYGLRANAAGQAYDDSVMRQLAAWGVDFIKVDCIASPYDGPGIAMLHRAILRSGRAMVLSLSPGPAPLAQAAALRRYAQMWRISGDVWDHWGPDPAAPWSQGLAGQFARLAAWAPYSGGGHWANADMLPIGYLGPHPPRRSRFTPAEQRTMITLWAIARSPLILGGNLLRMDAATLRLLTNPEVLAVDQSSRRSRAVLNTPDLSVWRARPRRGTGIYAAVFNLAAQPRVVTVRWRQLGLPPGRYAVRALWRRRELGRRRTLRLRLPGHGADLFRLVQSGR